MKGKIEYNLPGEGLTVPENWVNIAREGISTSPWAGKKNARRQKQDKIRGTRSRGNGAVPSPCPGIFSKDRQKQDVMCALERERELTK